MRSVIVNSEQNRCEEIGQEVTALNKEQIAESPAPDGEKEESWDNWKRDISFKRGAAFPVIAISRFRMHFLNRQIALSLVNRF